MTMAPAVISKLRCSSWASRGTAIVAVGAAVGMLSFFALDTSPSKTVINIDVACLKDRLASYNGDLSAVQDCEVASSLHDHGLAKVVTEALVSKFLTLQRPMLSSGSRLPVRRPQAISRPSLRQFREGCGGVQMSATQEASCKTLEGDKYLIAPSILSANFAKLGQEVDNVLAAGADVVHFDVMDNHYVPNLTIGPMVCKALRDHGVTAPIDVHLMVSPVDAMVEDFCKAGASYITFHPEATNHIDRTLQLIKSNGCKAGLVFNPATSLDIAKYVLDKIDIILLMSVNPGFGGQAFIPATIDKVREARKMIDESGYNIRIEVDGGVGPANIKAVAEAGADMFVAGSAILKEPRTEDAYKTTIDGMREELAKVNKA
jgi:ribulose-phosphate 3-epimerase